MWVELAEVYSHAFLDFQLKTIQLKPNYHFINIPIENNRFSKNLPLINQGAVIVTWERVLNPFNIAVIIYANIN